MNDAGPLATRLFSTPLGKAAGVYRLGFGTAPSAISIRRSPRTRRKRTLEAALGRWGCRYFDTAPLYGLGLSETRLNHFCAVATARATSSRRRSAACFGYRRLRAAPASANSSIRPPGRKVYDYSYDGVMRSIEASLERLGVDRIDILYCHDIDVYTHGSPAGADRRIRRVHGGRLSRHVEAARGGRRRRHRSRHQRVADCREVRARRRFRRLPARRPDTLSSNRNRSHRSCPIVSSEASGSRSAARTIPASSPRGRSPVPTTITRRRRRKSWTVFPASKRSARRMASS